MRLTLKLAARTVLAGALPTTMAVMMAMTQGCAAEGALSSDDADEVAEAELRAGGIANIVVRLSERDLGAIVFGVEDLESRGTSDKQVETYAIARALEALAEKREPATSLASDPDVAPQSGVEPGGIRPLGGYLWDHLKLNDLEIALCKSKKVKCLKTLYVAHRAKSKSKELYEDGENGGRRDAFRHSYWNARMVWAGGVAWAKAFGDAHENGYPESRDTLKGRLLGDMDFFNNDIGRSHGQRIDDDGDLIAALKTAIAKGELKAVRYDAAKDTGELVGTDTCTPAAPCGV